ncbi:MAG: CoA-binding protein [Dehalococcoidia bacterium]
MAELDRIPLQRTVAVVTDGSIVVRPSGRLVAPLIQAAIAGGAVALIVVLLNGGGSLLVMVGALLVAMVLGPAAVLGLVYNLVGSSVIVDRDKQSVTVQQGFLGLGLGTAELVPFWRIARIEVAGDYEDELSSGELQDIVQWEVLVVKDNDKIVEIGTAISARPFAADGLDRVNRLARAVAAMAGCEVREAALPESHDATETESALPRRRRVERAGRRPPPGTGEEGAGEEETVDATIDPAMELMRDARSIAVVGVSPSPERDSHDVARYLIEAGYDVYLVNPTVDEEVLGRRVYGSVQELPQPVDIVDVFRRSEHVPPVVDDAIAAGAKAVWMQLDIVNDAAAERARAAGLEVVMDRCTKIEHRRLMAET